MAGGSRWPTIRRRGGDPVPAEYGPVTAARRAMPGHQLPPNQIGLYGDNQLSQFPARWEGLMLRCGVEGLRDGWYTPSKSVVPDFQQTQYPAVNVSPQLMGANPGAPVGPVNVAAMQANVIAGQIRQSGLAAMSWARQLTPQS